MSLDRRQAVGQAADADELNEGVVVAGPAGVVVAASANAVVGEHGEKRGGHQRAYICSMIWLPRILISRKWCNCRRKAANRSSKHWNADGWSRRGPELLSGARVHAIVQRQFQHLHQIEVASEDVGLLAESARFDATAAAAGPGVFQRLALANLFLHDRIGVEDRREAIAVANHPQRMLQHRVRRLARQLQVAAGLQQVHLVDDLQQQVGDLVRAVGAVRQQTRPG